MYKDIPADLLRVIEPIARDHQVEVVDATRSGTGGRSRLRVVIDTCAGDGRVLLDECAAVSREIGHALDAEDLIDGSYVLEVCSPGVDRTLGREVDFERAVGGKIALETREPVEGRRRFRGNLVSFDAKGARVRTDGGEVTIPFERIARAKSVYPIPLAKR